MDILEQMEAMTQAQFTPTKSPAPASGLTAPWLKQSYTAIAQEEPRWISLGWPSEADWMAAGSPDTSYAQWQADEAAKRFTQGLKPEMVQQAKTGITAGATAAPAPAVGAPLAEDDIFASILGGGSNPEWQRWGFPTEADWLNAGSPQMPYADYQAMQRGQITAGANAAPLGEPDLMTQLEQMMLAESGQSPYREPRPPLSPESVLGTSQLGLTSGSLANTQASADVALSIPGAMADFGFAPVTPPPEPSFLEDVFGFIGDNIGNIPVDPSALPVVGSALSAASRGVMGRQPTSGDAYKAYTADVPVYSDLARDVIGPGAGAVAGQIVSQVPGADLGLTIGEELLGTELPSARQAGEAVGEMFVPVSLGDVVLSAAVPATADWADALRIMRTTGLLDDAGRLVPGLTRSQVDNVLRRAGKTYDELVRNLPLGPRGGIEGPLDDLQGQVRRVADEAAGVGPTPPAGAGSTATPAPGVIDEAAGAVTPSGAPREYSSPFVRRPDVATSPPAAPADTPTLPDAAPRPEQPATASILGIGVPEPRLGRMDSALNAFKRVSGYGVEAEETVTPIMRERARVIEVASQQANRIGAEARDAIKAFNFDDTGRIVDLPGAPTLQDLAAHLPEYNRYLNDAQRSALERIRVALEPYRAAMAEQGIDVHSRADVMEGGFYIPRGRADVEGAEAAMSIGSSRRAGSRKGFERGAVFDSMTEGIEAGYRYAAPGDAIEAYARDAGNRIADQFTANTLLRLEDDAGNLLAETAADRINPELREYVQTLRSKIQGRIQTALRQRSRAGAQRGAEDRLTRLLQRQEREIQRIMGDVERLSPTEAALKRAEAELTVAERLSAELDEANRAVRQADRLAGKADDLGTRAASLDSARNMLAEEQRRVAAAIDQATSEGILEATETGGRSISAPMRARIQQLKVRARAAANMDARLGRQQDRFAHRMQEITGQLDEMAGDIEPARIRSLERQIRAEEDKLVRAMSELSTSERAANRIAGTAQDVGESALRTEARLEGTVDELAQDKQELADIRATWERAKERALQTPRGQGRVDYTGLQAYSFPEAMADAINKELRVGQNQGSLIEVTRAINNLLRPIRATADLSFMGIQGLIGFVDRPTAYLKALTTAMRSMADPQASGAFLRAFDAEAARSGLPSSQDWIRSGLRFGGTDTEFTIGRGLSRVGDVIQRAPIVRQTNRAFGTFGDSLRLSMAQGEANAQRLLQSGTQELDMREIALAINRATGSGQGRFMGDLGDVAQFAPRYFQGQLEVIARAVASGNLEGYIARRQLAKLIGFGAAFTVAANEALGNEFDYYTPFKDGRFNPNYMRIRVPGVGDVSVFGGWDSLVRGLANAASGDPGYLLRTKASPVVSTAIDLFTGENFMGEPMPQPLKGKIDLERTENFLRSFLPFSSQGIGRDSLLGSGVNALGVKATPLSPSDRRQVMAQEQYGKNYDQLLESERRAVNEAVAEQIGQEPGELATARATTAEQRQQEQDQRENAFLNTVNRRPLPDEWSDFGQQRFGANSQFAADFKDTLAGFAERSFDKVVEGYFNIGKLPDGSDDPLYELPDGSLDWDLVRAEQDKYINSLSQESKDGSPSEFDYLADYLQTIEESRSVMEQEYRAFRNELSGAGYYDLPTDETGKRDPQAIEDFWKANPVLEAQNDFWGRFAGMPNATLESQDAVDVFLALNEQWGTDWGVKLAPFQHVINKNEQATQAWTDGQQYVNKYFTTTTDDRTKARDEDPNFDAWIYYLGYSANAKLRSKAAGRVVESLNAQYGTQIPIEYIEGVK